MANSILKKIESLEKLAAEREGAGRLPALIIHFNGDKDGLVPDMTDRPLYEWELYRRAGGLVVVDPFVEYGLRTGARHCAESYCHNKGAICAGCNPKPTPCADQCISQEAFCEWLCRQDTKQAAGCVG